MARLLWLPRIHLQLQGLALFGAAGCIFDFQFLKRSEMILMGVLDWDSSDWIAYDNATQKRKARKLKPVIAMHIEDLRQDDYEYHAVLTNRYNQVQETILVSNSLKNLKDEIKNRFAIRAVITRVFTKDNLGIGIHKGDTATFDFGWGGIENYVYTPLYAGQRLKKWS